MHLSNYPLGKTVERNRPATKAADAGKRPWTPPAVEELPRLTELTLQTGGIPGTGNAGGGGSTVF